MEWDGAYYWPERRKIRVLEAISKREEGRLESGDCWCHEDCFNSKPRKGTRIFPRNRKSCPHFWRGPGNFEKTGDCEYHMIQKLKNESTRYSQFYHDLRDWLNSTEAKESLQFSSFYEEKSTKYSDFIIKHNGDEIDWKETEILVRHKNRKRRPRTSNFIIVDLSQWTAEQLSDFHQFSVRKISEEFELLINRIIKERQEELERVRLQAEEERIRAELEEQKKYDLIKREMKLERERAEREKEKEEIEKLKKEREATIKSINRKCRTQFDEIKHLLDEILIEQQVYYRKNYYDGLIDYSKQASTHGIHGFPKFYDSSNEYVFPWDIDIYSNILKPQKVAFKLSYSNSEKIFLDDVILDNNLLLSKSIKWDGFSRILGTNYRAIKDEYKLIRTDDIVYTHNLVEDYCISHIQNREIKFLKEIESNLIEELGLAKNCEIYQSSHKNWIEFEKYTNFVIERMDYYKSWQNVYHSVASSNPDSHSAYMFDKSEDIIEHLENEHKLYTSGGLEFKRYLYQNRKVEIDGDKLIVSSLSIINQTLIPGYSMLEIPVEEYNLLNDREKKEMLNQKFIQLRHKNV